MHSAFALVVLAATALAAPAYHQSCSYECPDRDAHGGQLIAGIAVLGQLQCTYFLGMCTYSSVSSSHRIVKYSPCLPRIIGHGRSYARTWILPKHGILQVHAERPYEHHHE
jgi:hypothetical protein